LQLITRLVRQAVFDALSDARKSSRPCDDPGAVLDDRQTCDDAKFSRPADTLEEQIRAPDLDGPEDARLRDVHMISSCGGRETVLREGHPEREGRVLVHDSDVPRDERKVHALVREARYCGCLRRGDEGNSRDEVVGTVVDVRDRIVE